MYGGLLGKRADGEAIDVAVMNQAQMQGLMWATTGTAGVALLAGDPSSVVVAGICLVAAWRTSRREGFFRAMAAPSARSVAARERFAKHGGSPLHVAMSRPEDSGASASPDGRDHPSDGQPSSLSYEEFTSGLEEEEPEEISFLPPYIGAGEGRAMVARQPVSDTAAPVSQTLAELRDAGREAQPGQPRHFALGTVAILRRLLEPQQVERILAEQRRSPRLRFGDVAMQLGLLTEEQLQELLLAQQQGQFTRAEIRDALERVSRATS